MKSLQFIQGRYVRTMATILCFFTASSFAQENDLKMTAVFITSNKITIDGNLNEPEWTLSEVATNFIQTDPDDGKPSTERTEVRVLYDNDNLYVGVYCYDSAGGEGLTVTQGVRDFSPGDGDHFSMIFDTFNDKRNGYVFSTNPRGAKREGQMGGDGERRTYDWDAIWYVKSKITDEGWQAEFSIPFRTLRFRDAEEQVWGLNFTRRIRRKNESIHWSPVPQPYRLSKVSYAGTLDGLSGIRQGRNFYVKPYVSSSILRRKEDDVDFFADGGLDLKYGITPGLTLDITMNTDFSQVEADQQQVNLSRFPLFFPEKRDFFLENTTMFQVRRQGRSFRSRSRDLIAFFSRRIGLDQGRATPILGGVRLTGRMDKYRLGFLSVQTDNFEELSSTNFLVARVRRDILKSSDVGGIFINKQAVGGDYNRTYGVDGHFQFFKYLEIASFVLKTDTPGLRRGNVSFDTLVSWEDNRYKIEVDHLSIGENFNPEVGFVRRTGIKKSRGEFNRKFQPKERISWIRQITPSAGIEYITDQANRVESKSLDQTLSIMLEDGGSMGLTHRARFERLDRPFVIRSGGVVPEGDYTFWELNPYFFTDRTRMFSGGVELEVGDFFDGHKTSYITKLQFQPSFRFATHISWTHDDLDLASGKFSTDLISTKLNYVFNTRMFLNALVQYNGTLQEVSSNIRFNFIYKPLSNFFLVYNDRRTFRGNVLERALIVKVTYALDF
ncbi:MAG: DUF5916 domain-containing protein [Acidobacteriota bacterium]|nr:DUF5916 domain-containing protein [Acidobacteriota bacterium]